jgi:hypothetical protein
MKLGPAGEAFFVEKTGSNISKHMRNDSLVDEELCYPPSGPSAPEVAALNLQKPLNR